MLPILKRSRGPDENNNAIEITPIIPTLNSHLQENANKRRRTDDGSESPQQLSTSNIITSTPNPLAQPIQAQTKNPIVQNRETLRDYLNRKYPLM
jgi:hypothetical protein